jgi:hopanoid C-3 methylase
MRLLLVQPPQGTRFGLSRILTGEPLGLECVGGAVRSRGYDAELVDMRLDTWESLDRALDDRPAALGISCAFTTDVYPTYEIARFVKERWPALPIVIGGHHASLVPDDFLYPGSHVDAIAVGEGEMTGIGIMDALRERRPLESVPGVLTLANKGDGFRERPFSRELDELPEPDRSLSARYRKWYHHGPNPRAAYVETSRGCPFDCNFCSVWVFYNRRAGRRSPAAICRELERMPEETVMFTDDIAFLNHESYKELGERIKASGMKKNFSCETRCDLVVKYRDLFAKWKEIGLNSIFLGVEKVDDEGLASIRKRMKGGSNTSVEAIRTLRDVGIKPMTIFITDPQWDEADFDRLEAFIDGMELPSTAYTIMTPLPGTEMYNQRKHEIVNHDYGYYDVVHTVMPTKLPLERFYERFANLYTRTTREIRPTWTMARQAAKMALQGDLWVIRKTYGAAKEMRDPKAYLKGPIRVLAPRRNTPSGPGQGPDAAEVVDGPARAGS